MVADSRVGGGQRSRHVVATWKVNVGDGSDTDADESAHKLLGRDSFRVIKDRRGTKKESAGYNGFADVQKQPMGYRGFADVRKHVDHNVPLLRTHYPSQQVARGGDYIRNSVYGGSKEFRVVKDNRVNQNANGEVREVQIQLSTSGNEQQLSCGPDKLASSDQTARDSNGSIHSVVLKKPSEEASNAKAAESSASRIIMHEDTLAAVSTSEKQSSEGNSMAHSSASSSNSIVGVHSSFSDPVHVPSPISRSAGKVGTIQREIGVVGGRSQSSYHSSVSDSSLSISFSIKDNSLESQPSGQPADTSTDNLLDQTTVQTHMYNVTSNKSIQSSYRNNKLHQSSGFHQKATQSNFEWKPKPVQKPNSVCHAVAGNNSAATSHTDDSCNSNAVDISEHSLVSTARNLHVIIPQHLQVPDLEQLQLSFGSFGFESNPTNELSSAIEQAGNTKPLADGPSISTPAPGIDTTTSNMDSFVVDHGAIVDDQPSPFHSGYSASATGYEELGPGINDAIATDNIEQYDDIGFVQSNSPLYHSSKEQYQKNPRLSSFSEYANQSNYDAPFFETTSADNTLRDGTLSEVFPPYVVPNSPSPTMVFSQLGQPVQQQQAVAQLYPQVHLQQYPNFVPFRHFLSPVYVPPIALSNYSGNPAYPHPSTGNSYHVMPGGSSNINAGGLNYPNPQYKPLASGSPTAYDHYSNPNGTFGTMTGFEDMTRHKFKDNNLYVPNPQVETSDMWMHTPQELTSLQSQYYNLPGQARNVGFMPAHAGQAAFSAAVQPSLQQYPGLYHTQQPPSVTSPHHLMHQNVPPTLGGGIGVPGPQFGAYHQPQLGHYNWTTNF